MEKLPQLVDYCIKCQGSGKVKPIVELRTDLAGVGISKTFNMCLVCLGLGRVLTKEVEEGDFKEAVEIILLHKGLI